MIKSRFLIPMTLLYMLAFQIDPSNAEEVSLEFPPSKHVEEIETWDRVVCIKSRDASNPQTGRLCSAFMIRKHNRLFLITAGHASSETNGESQLHYLDPQNQPQWVTLKSIVEPSKNPWNRDSVSDLAVAELIQRKGNEPYISHLNQLAFDEELLASTASKRRTEITTIGFPLGIGSSGTLSPLAVPGHIVSKELPAKNDWGTEPIIFSSPPLAQGTSGGPAIITADDATCEAVVGMYIGVMNDQSGAKLSKLVPSRLIKQLINEANQSDPSHDEAAEAMTEKN